MFCLSWIIGICKNNFSSKSKSNVRNGQMWMEDMTKKRLPFDVGPFSRGLIQKRNDTGECNGLDEITIGNIRALVEHDQINEKRIQWQ